MGLFGDIGKVFGTVTKAVATGGISLVAPKLIPKPISQALDVVSKAQFPTSLKSLTSTGLAVATKNPALLVPTGTVYAPQGVNPMGLNVGGILGQVGTIFGGNQNPIFEGISNVAGLASQFFPMPSPVTSLAVRPPPGFGTLPLVGRAAGGMVARGFFQRFPNLGLAIQQLRDRGFKVRRAQLWNLLKRFGPEVLITGGLLTAAAVSELMVAGPGHRRMNPANSKALRRSVRRIKSFHRLCVSTDLIKTGARRGRSRRCVTCRKDPCRC